MYMYVHPQENISIYKIAYINLYIYYFVSINFFFLKGTNNFSEGCSKQCASCLLGPVGDLKLPPSSVC